MIAAIYARKSNDEGDKDAADKSVARQIASAKEYASKRGWVVRDDCIFTDDGISGAEFKRRPGLTKLLASVDRFKVLVVSEQSRLGRDTFRTLFVVKQIEDAGIAIWSYLDNRQITLEDDMGEVEGFMRSWASAQERKKASQRVRDTMLKRA